MPDQPATEAEERHARPFAEFLIEQGGGITHHELSEKFHDLIAAVTDTGKAGQISLTVKVKPATKTGGNTLIITDSVAVKLPSRERQESIFFVDRAGNVTRNDPRQPQLPLREVSAPATPTELKDVAR